MRQLPCWLLLTWLLTACAAPSAAPDDQHADPRLAWWREARFGLFLHWGLYAIPAGKWQDQTDHGEWIRETAHIPVKTYEQFQAQWNPKDFDADAWVRMAKAAGMQYVVITTKHHDGFCLFDSAATDWDVMGTPWQRDVMRELSAACRRHGLRIGWYHSIMDWHHPDYLPRRSWEKDRPTAGADMARYIDYLHRQVTELLTHYGPIDVMWFDGEWENTWTHALGKELYALCRQLQPSVLVNNRVDTGRNGMQGLTRDGEYVGDFGTPEQEVPPTGLPGVDWETCMTMNRHWGFNAADRDWKSARELIRTLVDVASKGGNLLLNIGPRADGTFPPEAVERLAAIGRWMERHGEAIRGTSASPLPPLPFGRCTWKTAPGGARLFLHVFDVPANGELRLTGLGNTVRSATLLGGPTLPFSSADGVVTVRMPAAGLDADCPVVALDLDGAPIVYKPPAIVAGSSMFVDQTTVALAAGTGLDVHYTTDGGEPTMASPVATGPLLLRESTTVRARCSHGGHLVGDTAARTFTRVTPRPAATPPQERAGLQCAQWQIDCDRLPDLGGKAPDREYETPGPVLPGGPAAEHVVRAFTGYLRVPASGIWTFALTSDDGSRLSIDGQPVVDNDGLHGAVTANGEAALAAGWHRVRVDWFNKTGGAELDLKMASVGQLPAAIPAAAFCH